MLRTTLDRLLDREHLSESEAFDLVHQLTSSELPAAMGGALLAALRAKGVTPEELRGFASGMRKLARRPVLGDGSPLVDMVGTGGDASGSLNLSTGSALLVAAMGIRVAKHGTTSISSRSGSADAVRALGVPLPLDEYAAGSCLAATNFTFLFAPHYHPAMKAIMPVRQALGVRTVFNILGPLSNPAEPPFHLIGAFNEPTAALMADALAGLPIERAYVVHGDPGWDEATPVGPFVLFDVHRGNVVRHVRDAAEFGMPRCRAEELRGGDAAHNASRMRAVLCGEEHGAHRHALVLQAALVLELMGLESSPIAAAQRAAGAIDDGRAAQVLERLATFSNQHRSDLQPTA